ncbi:MAG: uncharacterized protein JWR21_56, partial [Herminiimonas sp.]|nr:uncharacterized protein [Herminiimonas sp.]
MFVNQASDWHLKAGSPAMNMGVATSITGYDGIAIDVSRDMNGVVRTAPWDLGIYSGGIKRSRLPARSWYNRCASFAPRVGTQSGPNNWWSWVCQSPTAGHWAILTMSIVDDALVLIAKSETSCSAWLRIDSSFLVLGYSRANPVKGPSIICGVACSPTATD